MKHRTYDSFFGHSYIQLDLVNSIIIKALFEYNPQILDVAFYFNRIYRL